MFYVINEDQSHMILARTLLAVCMGSLGGVHGGVDSSGGVFLLWVGSGNQPV